MTGSRAFTYVLPLRRWSVEPQDELAAYLRRLARMGEVIVVDGSAPEVFAAHGRWFAAPLRHVPVDADLHGLSGKANGVVTGVRAATHERVVLADDDVRYDGEALERVVGLLEVVDVVRPQNYFDPLPWHAAWDTARSLLNRAFGADFPGTLGLRRSRFLAVGGYDGDCLFENLELIRTIEAAGGTVASPLDLYVRRLPPGARHFWSQRVRQAYDDFAMPLRLAAELTVVPGVAAAVVRRRPLHVLAGAAIAVGLAEKGRRRGGGAATFPPVCSLLAPVWVAERGVCAWLAVWSRVRRGGVAYAGTVFVKSASSPRQLRRRLGHLSAGGAGRGGGGDESAGEGEGCVLDSGAVGGRAQRVARLVDRQGRAGRRAASRRSAPGTPRTLAPMRSRRSERSRSDPADLGW